MPGSRQDCAPDWPPSPLLTARALLVHAETAADPRPLIAAARALLDETTDQKVDGARALSGA